MRARGTVVYAPEYIWAAPDDGKKYQLVEVFNPGNTLRSELFPDLAAPVADIFAE